MNKIQQKMGNKRKYDFPSLINVGDSLTVLGGDVKGIRSAAMMYSALHHNKAWKFEVSEGVNERGDQIVTVKRAS